MEKSAGVMAHSLVQVRLGAGQEHPFPAGDDSDHGLDNSRSKKKPEGGRGAERGRQ